MFTYDPMQVYSPVDANGNARGANMGEAQVLHVEQCTMLSMLAATGGGWLIYLTRAGLYADLSPNTGAGAMVVGDTTVAYNGIYRKAGAPDTGAWGRVADLPNSFIKASNAGAGTANEIVATSTTPIPSGDGAALIILPITTDNTSSTVTVAFNGGTALTIKTNSGASVPAGGLVAGMMVAGFKVGTQFRLLSDIATSADRVAAEAAAQDAADALHEFRAKYLGALSADPSTDLNGDAVADGAFYVNTSSNRPRFRSSGAWNDPSAIDVSLFPLALINGKIVESHTGNAVTFAIKTQAGNNPSPSDPVGVSFLRNDGTYLGRQIVAATSITISSGSTLGASSNLPFHLLICAIDNAGTVELAVANRQVRTTAAGDSDGGMYINEVNAYSTTAEGGLGAADSAMTLYSTTARTSKPIRVLALASYGSGLATAGAWVASPSAIRLNIPGAKGIQLPIMGVAHRGNDGGQYLFDGVYTAVNFGTTRHNVGGCWNKSTSVLTPPAGWVKYSGGVWLDAGVDNPPTNLTMKWWKNGQTVESGAAVGYAPAGFANTGAMMYPTYRDLCDGAETYKPYVYFDNAANTNIGHVDSNPQHVWISWECGDA
ncbi:MAG: hypothetical protein JSR61_02640 [Proteobacteria bacterium]|nr:hypothetical protein [Pseudomonadota bacterium]